MRLFYSNLMIFYVFMSLGSAVKKRIEKNCKGIKKVAGIFYATLSTKCNIYNLYVPIYTYVYACMYMHIALLLFQFFR